MSGLVNKAIGIGVACLVAGIMIPMGLSEIANATLTNVDPAVQTVFTVVLPVLAVIGIAVAFWRN